LTWPLLTFIPLTFIPWITAHGIHRPILEISLARTEAQVEVRAGNLDLTASMVQGFLTSGFEALPGSRFYGGLQRM
jgi:hypothetical protein